MATIGSLLSAALQSRARELADAGAAPARTVTTRIGMSARNRSLVAVLVVGALASAAPLLNGDDTVTPLPNPSPSVGTFQTVTAPLDANLWEGALYPGGLDCGSQVPEPNVSDRGFYLETAVERAGGDEGTSGATGGADAGSGTPTIGMSTTYLGEEIERAVVGQFLTYVVSDGKVVALVESFDGIIPTLGTTISTGERLDGGTVTAGDLNTSYISPCDFDYHSSEPLLEAGTYELVVTQRIQHTPQTLALLELENSRYTVIGSDWGLWQPGSIDCKEAVENDIDGFRSAVPVQCDPIGAKAAGIEISGDQVTLPYEVSSGPLDLDVTLVSEPIEWIAKEDIPYDTDRWWVDQEEDPEDFTCDATLDWWHPEGIEGDNSARNVEELTAQGGAAIAFDIRAVSSLQLATVQLGTPAHAWLLRDAGGAQQLVATADASFAPPVVPIDRAKDYARTAIQLNHIAICPGQEQAEASEDHQMWLIVATDIAIDDGAGTRDTTSYMIVTLGQE